MYITAAVKTLHLLHAVMLWRTQNSYMYSISDLEQLGVNSASQFFQQNIIVHFCCLLV